MFSAKRFGAMSKSRLFDVVSAVYSGKSGSTLNQGGDPTCVTFSSNGLQLYVGRAGQNGVYQYTLSTAWDVSTIPTTFTKFISISGQESADPAGIAFSADGTKMYMHGITNKIVYQYTLSTAWDVSTATYASKYKSLTAQEASSAFGLAFSPDGLAMFVLGASNSYRILKYTLSTAWDVSTATYASMSAALSTVDTTRGFTFSPDGRNLYINGMGTVRLYQYILGTAWDVTTAAYGEQSAAITTGSLSRDLSVSPDGSKLYIASISSDAIEQYTMG
jgi:sugar lactone lactonase YvrE